jgi:hypothetical protein
MTVGHGDYDLDMTVGPGVYDLETWQQDAAVSR